MHLVIVESPAKGRTIKNILGNGYKVLASFGHVRDLPQKELGVDLKNNFQPKYTVPAKARKIVQILKKEIAKADNLYLATDYDREGEAIAWHIIKAVGLDKSKTQNPKLKTARITFHEITKPAVLEALRHPREIDMNLVDAQQARRVLDRLVGYKLSPFLWQKVAQGLSAGRVQSVAVRLVVEREREIRQFIPQEYWQIEAELAKKGANQTFKAILVAKDGQKIEKLAIKNQKQAQEILDDLEGASYQVQDIQVETKTRWPQPPFTTSTLQQEAARRFGFSARQTMRLAQGLYEDGLITYMRTDSVQVSPLAVAQARQVIAKKYGHDYLPAQGRIYKTKTIRAQEAHEAIRPTDLSRQEILGQSDRQKLYDLIWKRMLASQMKEAVFEETNVNIAAKNFGFRATGVKIKFDGFLKVVGQTEEAKLPVIPPLVVKEMLDLKNLKKSQNFTEPPPRYSEGTLVRELEKRGIGRPSTYAPTLATIIERGYVEKIQGKLIPKEIGEIVNDLLVEHFPSIVDYKFTSKMEEELDEIAEGRLKWQKVIGEFYEPFAKVLKEKSQAVTKKALEEDYDKNCPECGKPLKIKIGRFGKFLACSGFPECKYTEPLLENHVGEEKSQKITQEIAKEKCPQCGKNLVVKEGKFGTFLACEGYPQCQFTKSIEIPANVPCPNCGGRLLKKRTRSGKIFWGCENYPQCQTAFWDEPQTKRCPKCQGILTLNSKLKILKCSQCDWKENV